MHVDAENRPTFPPSPHRRVDLQERLRLGAVITEPHCSLGCRKRRPAVDWKARQRTRRSLLDRPDELEADECEPNSSTRRKLRCDRASLASPRLTTVWERGGCGKVREARNRGGQSWQLAITKETRPAGSIVDWRSLHQERNPGGSRRQQMNSEQ
jgi:hypothetical protein